MDLFTFAGIPITVGASEAVHRQRILDEEAEAEDRQDEFYLDVFCDAQSRKKDEVHDAIVVLKDGKVCISPNSTATFTLMHACRSAFGQKIKKLNSQPLIYPMKKIHHIPSQASTCHSQQKTYPTAQYLILLPSASSPPYLPPQTRNQHQASPS